jgi:hypothetical protein
VVWVKARQSISNISWSWDEGRTALNCSLGAVGRHTVHEVSSAPSRDGLRVHMLTENGGKNYVVTLDFSTLRDSGCQHEDNPNDPLSDYELWTPKTPDGEQGCLLGQKLTYVRRKANVKCFNLDADLERDPVNCTCAREDYECDDCFEREQFWDPNSRCVRSSGYCSDAPNPCAHGETTYLETKGYKKLSVDYCVPPAGGDSFAPVSKTCVAGSTQSTTTLQTTQQSSLSSSSSAIGTSAQQSSQSSSITTKTTSSQSASTPPSSTAPSSGGSKVWIAAVVIVLLLLGGGTAAFLVLRKNPACMKRFGGKIPGIAKPETDPYSTLGELETGNSGFDEDVSG